MISNVNGFARGPELENTRSYMGSLMSFLINGNETEGRIAVVEGIARPGNEPPPHVHPSENEIYYILQGKAEFFIEDQEQSILAGDGEIVFLPRGKAHAIYLRSESFRFLLLAQAVGDHQVGLDAMFRHISEPAVSMELPRDAMTYAAADPAEVVAVGLRHGVQFLAPADAKERLPNYPGFEEILARLGQ
jgi:quercetin dioxygenase-like cupin family protein